MTTRQQYEARREAVAARITSDPRRFNMRAVSMPSECGTVCCIAGHTLEEMGVKWIVDNNGFTTRYELFGVDDTTNGAEWELAFDSDNVSARWTKDAADYLGLNYFEADEIFYDFDIISPEDAALRLKGAGYVNDQD